MPELSPNNKRHMDKLLKGYESLSRWKKWFLPSNLKTALIHYQEMPSTSNALPVCVALVKDTWLFQKIFFSCLNVFSASVLDLATNALNRENLLTGDSASDYFNVVVGHQHSMYLARALSSLSRAKLLADGSAGDNFKTVVAHRDPELAAEALKVLSEANLLTGDSGSDNFNAVTMHQDPRSVARVLSFLSWANLLAGDSGRDNRNAVAGHENPRHVYWALSVLIETNLLAGDSAQANFNAVFRHQNPLALSRAFECFCQARSLNQTSLSHLIAFTPILFGNEVAQDCWDRIPHGALTQLHITAIFDLCRQHQADVANGRIAFVEYVNRVVLRHDARAPVINRAQSTHTASVHQSISQSAINLMRAYGTNISGDRLDVTIQNILRDFAKLPQETQHIDVAKRCVQRLIAGDYSFTDRTSNVSIKQLLALAWIAIHDDKKRQGTTLNDAKNLFIEGLYEAQRGYNLSAENVDNGAVDASICMPGTFNKLMEKLAGIHSDVKIIYLTHATAALKFPIICRDESEKYLASLANPSSLSEYLAAVRIMQQVKDEGAEVIWSEIKAKVGHRTFEEFGSLYRDANDEHFLALIAAGVDVDLSGIPETFQESIGKSAGFCDYCSGILMRQGFFASSDCGQMAEVLQGNLMIETKTDGCLI